jgi:hypothetical protein
VIDFTRVEGDSRADSDWDYYGYTESDWEVCDRRGRPAPWLERKLTAKEADKINDLVSNYFKESSNDY